MSLIIDYNWTFKQVVDNIEALKQDYLSFLDAFFRVKTSQPKLRIRDYRNAIFNLKIEYWQKERIWEVLNDDFSIEELQRIVKYTN